MSVDDETAPAVTSGADRDLLPTDLGSTPNDADNVAITVPARWPGYIPALDGIRGIAIAATLVGHLSYGDWGIVVPGLAGNWLGVSMFFTLSGFLITSLLISERDRSGRVSMSAFWSRRARRLLPALYLSLVVVMGLTLAGVMPVAPHFGQQVTTTVLYVKNVVYLYAHGENSANLFQFWSLSIEEQFYVFFPILFVLAWKLARRKAVLLFIGSMVVADVSLHQLRGNLRNWDVAYFGPTRFGDILTGVVVAFVAATPTFRRGLTRTGFRRGLQVVGVLAFAFLASLVHGAELTWNRYWSASLYGNLAVSALILAVLVPGPATWLLSIRPLRWLGKISYSAYLYHVAVYFVLSRDRTHIDNHTELVMLRFAVVFLLSWLSFRWFESPLRHRRTPAGWRLAAAYATPAALIIAFALMVHFPGSPAAVPERHAVVEAGGFGQNDQDAPANAPGIEIFGDQLANGSLPGLHSITDNSSGSYWVAFRAVNDCPLVSAFTVALNGVAHAPSRDCTVEHFTRAAITRVEHARTVVIWAGVTDLASHLMYDGSWQHLGTPSFDADQLQRLDTLAAAWAKDPVQRVDWVLLDPDTVVHDFRAAERAARGSSGTIPSTVTLPGAKPPLPVPADATDAELRSRALVLNDLIRRVAAAHPNVRLHAAPANGRLDRSAWLKILG